MGVVGWTRRGESGGGVGVGRTRTKGRRRRAMGAVGVDVYPHKVVWGLGAHWKPLKVGETKR